MDSITIDNIQYHWDRAIHYGYETRKNNLDGLERWNKFMFLNNLDKDMEPIFIWRKSLIDYKLINNEGEDHFIYQIYRLRAETPANFARVLQLAYNIGQWNVNHSKSTNIRTYLII